MRWEERRIDVTFVGSGTRSIPGVRVHRARSLDERDVWHRDGMRVTSPARTCSTSPPYSRPRRCGARRARRRPSGASTSASSARSCARSNGHRGVAALRAIVEDGPAPTRSDLEDALLDLLDGAGIERPEINAPLRLDGRRIVPDYLWRAHGGSRSKPTAAAGTTIH